MKIVIIIIVAFTVIAFFSATIILAAQNKNNDLQPEDIVRAYLEYAQKQDIPAIKKMVSKNRMNIDAAIAAKINKYNNVKIERTSITEEPTESSFFTSYRVQAEGTKGSGEHIKIEDTLHFQKEQNSGFLSWIAPRYTWVLVIGDAKEQPVNQAPASTP